MGRDLYVRTWEKKGTYWEKRERGLVKVRFAITQLATQSSPTTRLGASQVCAREPCRCYPLLLI